MNNLDYGIIGNCQSAALISKTGSLEWCCLPNFDSSSVFAKILDEKKVVVSELLHPMITKYLKSIFHQQTF